jgi:hypothetical protein
LEWPAMDHFFYLDLRNGAHLHQAASTRKHGYGKTD